MLISRVVCPATLKIVMEINTIRNSILDLTERVTALRGYL